MESVIGWKWPIPAARLQFVLKRPRPSFSTLSILLYYYYTTLENRWRSARSRFNRGTVIMKIMRNVPAIFLVLALSLIFVGK